MVMMVHYVGVLPAHIEPKHLGAQWRSHLKDVQERRFKYWIGAPQWLDARPHKQLDWGTILYEVTTDDVMALTGRDDFTLPSLDDGERYAAVWVECY